MADGRLTLMRAVGRVHREWRRHMRKCALEVGIPESYMSALMFLSRHPGANQRMIAEFTETTTAAVNQVVKRMTDDGLIRKETSASDGRHTCLYLTETGISKAELLRARLGRSDGEITERIGEVREGEMIKDLLDISFFISTESL